MALRRKRAHPEDFHPSIGDTLPKTENQSFAGVTSAAVLDSAKRASRPNLILAICCMSLLIVGMDVTIVNVALAAIQIDLHTRPAGLQWIKAGRALQERLNSGHVQVGSLERVRH